MTSHQAPTLSIHTHAERPELSKTQKRFNSLMKKIAGQKQKLADWQEALPVIQERLETVYRPLLQREAVARKQVVLALDQACSDKKIKGREKDRVSEIICTLCSQLLMDERDDVLEDIYNRHSESDFSAELEEQQLFAKAMVEQLLGTEVDISPEPGEAPDEFMQRVMEREIERRQAESDNPPDVAPAADGRAERKKTKKQIEAEAKREQAEKAVGQSLRDVYRKLAASLHPDREMDERERARKTELMQRVNIAYESKDLLSLLNLQIEIEQIDQAHIDTLPDARLNHYIEILKEQVAELDDEVMSIQMPFIAMLQMNPHAVVSPKTLMLKLGDRIREVDYFVRSCEVEVKQLNDPKFIKAWVKQNYDAIVPQFELQDYF